MSAAQHSLVNPLTHPDSSSQLPHGTATRFPHPNTGGHVGANTFTHPAGPHPGAGFGGHPGPIGSRGPGKFKIPRAGQFHPIGFPIGTGAQFSPLRGLLDNRFLQDRQRFGLSRFRATLSAEERIRFLAALRGCRGCNFNLLQFIFGIQYFPQFAHLGLCASRPTGCGIWILGVNGCWFRISAAEASIISPFGGPAPITIPCGPGFHGVGFGPGFGFRPVGFHGFGRGFPAHRNSIPFGDFGGHHPGGPGPGRGGPGQGPGGGPPPGVLNQGDSSGNQGAGIQGREHPQPGS